MRNVSQAAHSAERSPARRAHAPSRVGDGALAVANFSGLSGSPFSTEKLSLGEDGLGGFFFEVWRVAMFSQEAFDHDFDLGARALTHGPVGRKG